MPILKDFTWGCFLRYACTPFLKAPVPFPWTILAVFNLARIQSSKNLSITKFASSIFRPITLISVVALLDLELPFALKDNVDLLFDVFALFDFCKYLIFTFVLISPICTWTSSFLLICESTVPSWFKVVTKTGVLGSIASLSKELFILILFSYRLTIN